MQSAAVPRAASVFSEAAIKVDNVYRTGGFQPVPRNRGARGYPSEIGTEMPFRISHARRISRGHSRC